MNALLFLATRRFVNSFRRAFNNPGRTVGTIAVVAMLLAVYGGPLLAPAQQPPSVNHLLDALPPFEIAASILTLMVFGFLALSFEVALNYTRAFTESDVSNLFPTPLSRRMVFQFSIFMKGLLGSAVGAGVIAYFLYRTTRTILIIIPGGLSLGSGVLGAMGFALLFIFANGAILQLGVVCGLRLFSNKTRRVVLWSEVGSVFAIFAGILFWHYPAYSAPGSSFFGTLLRQLNQPPAAWAYLPFRAIADCSFVPLLGWTGAIPIGVGLWAAFFILIQKRLVRYTPSMYEYATHLAQGNTKRREMMKQRSFHLSTRSAGKKATAIDRGRTWRWMDSWVPAGAIALFWRNLLLVRRFGGLLVVKIYTAVTVLLGAGILLLRLYKPGTPPSELLAFGGAIQFLLIFSFVPSNIAWLSQTLKQSEIQKPLPIAPWKMIVAELMTPTLAVAFSNSFGLLVLTLLFPHRWAFIFLGYVTAGSGFMVMCCLLFIVLLFNPDLNDTLQRMLFGIYQLLVFLAAFFPAAIVIGGGMLLHGRPVLLGIILLAVNGCCVCALIPLAAKKYESFNPVD